MTDEQPTLPGLGARPTDRAVTDLEDAVRTTIAAHHQAEHLTAADAGKIAVALELCRIAGQKRAGGRLSTVSNDLRLLTEILDSLVPSTDADADRALAAAMRDWEAVIKDGPATDPRAEVRDPAGP